jgi:FKBP-type peptidyl-prolyl cis-trans isomerase FkpA
MAETRKRDRVVALAIAIFFFAFASLLSILVIYQMITTKKNNNQASTQTTTTQKKTLAGTQLQGFTPVSSVSKLQISDTKVGTGATAKAGDTVTVNYTGAVASTGVIFQSTQDTGQPVPLSLNSVIKGWQDGIPGMKVGGTRRLLIPADEAYGATPPQGSGIPANAPLVFDIQLVKIGS